MFTRQDVLEMVDSLFHKYASSFRVEARDDLYNMMERRENVRLPEKITKVHIKVTKNEGSDSHIDEIGDVPGTWEVIFGKPAERELSALMALDMFYAKFSPHDPESELQFIVIDPDTNDILEEDEENYFGYSEAHRGDIERLYHVEEQTKLYLQKLFGNV